MEEWHKFRLLVLLTGVLLLCVFAQPAKADCSIAFGGWSKHFISNDQTDGKLNEDHNVAGIQCNRYSVHYFQNSYGRNSIGVGYDRPLYDTDRLAAGYYLGVWSGYRAVSGDAEVIPVVSPKVTYRLGRFEMNFLINPVVGVMYFGWRL